MIGRIRGTLVANKPPEILVEVHGLTYEVLIPMSTASRLPEVGGEVQLHTHFVVREDAQLLYGFFQDKDKALFRALIRVNGVGPKMALAILSGMDADDFVRAVHNNGVSALVKMPGIGKKTAERLIVEMRDCLEEWSGGDPAAPMPPGTESASSHSREAEIALRALGYKSTEAARAIALVVQQQPDVADSESLTRLALRSMR